jgi:hypothetical protein
MIIPRTTCVLCGDPIPRGTIHGNKSRRGKRAITCGKLHARYYKNAYHYLINKVKRGTI